MQYKANVANFYRNTCGNGTANSASGSHCIRQNTSKRNNTLYEPHTNENLKLDKEFWSSFNSVFTAPWKNKHTC